MVIFIMALERKEGHNFKFLITLEKKKILFTVSLKDSFFFCAYVIQDMYKFLEIFNYQNAIYKQIISSW